MRFPSELTAETKNNRCFGGLDGRQRHNGIKSEGHKLAGSLTSSSLTLSRLPGTSSSLRDFLPCLSVLVIFFCSTLSHTEVFGTDEKPSIKFVRLQSPWQRGVAPGSSFEISVDGSRFSIHGDVVDTNVVSPTEGEPALDYSRYDHILFAWSFSPLALEFEEIEIFPNGQFRTFRKDLSKKEAEPSSHLLPELRVTKTANGFRFECDIVPIKGEAFDATNNAPLYVSLSQIDVSRDGEASRWYCSSIPATLQPDRFHASSFARLDSFPSEKQEIGEGDVLTQSKLVNSSFRIAEFELRNKWDQYASQPSTLSLAQKWYEDITSFPDSERFLERTRSGERLKPIDLGDEQTPKRLTDARSERINQLLGQSWSINLGRIEDLSTCLPLTIRTSTSMSDTTQFESLVMWLESNRLQIALLQNNAGVYWGSTSLPLEHASHPERVTSITLASDGSTNGVGYELYANSKPLNLITHQANNLRLPTDSPTLSENQSKLAHGEWSIKTTNANLKIDLYNTKLTPIEILSLDPNAKLLSWSELTEEMHEAWRLHYVFCIDPEGRYYLESLKHYTSSQAELLRRSKKPAKK
ncbi:MAG: hypothetical protein ACK5YR_17710 [Pirellula sp.]|jgi:hypothetical protein